MAIKFKKANNVPAVSREVEAVAQNHNSNNLLDRAKAAMKRAGKRTTSYVVITAMLPLLVVLPIGCKSNSESKATVSDPVSASEYTRVRDHAIEEGLILARGGNVIDVKATIRNINTNQTFTISTQAMTRNADYLIGIMYSSGKAAFAVSAVDYTGHRLTSGGKPVMVDTDIKDGDAIEMKEALTNGQFLAVMVNTRTGKKVDISFPDNSRDFVYPERIMQIIAGADTYTGVKLIAFSGDDSRNADKPEVTFEFANMASLAGNALVFGHSVGPDQLCGPVLVGWDSGTGRGTMYFSPSAFSVSISGNEFNAGLAAPVVQVIN